VDLTTALLTGLGLATAAGLNAYIPLLLAGLGVRLFDVELAAPFDQLGSTPVLIVVGVLLGVEVFADKIPIVDTINDVIGTVVRPLAGALLMAASVGVVDDGPTWWPVVLGLVTAGTVHGAKATFRPVANATTGGLAAPVVSTIEDIASVVLTILAFVVPVLAVIAAAVVVAVLVRRLRARRKAGRSGMNVAAAGATPPAAADGETQL
jgi:disulfide bond formation protein DsbB